MLVCFDELLDEIVGKCRNTCAETFGNSQDAAGLARNSDLRNESKDCDEFPLITEFQRRSCIEVVSHNFREKMRQHKKDMWARPTIQNEQS